MDNPKNDRYYLDRLLNDLSTIERHMAHATEERFAADEVLQDAMMFRLIQVSENARKLTDAFKAVIPRCRGVTYTACETGSSMITAP